LKRNFFGRSTNKKSVISDTAERTQVVVVGIQTFAQLALRGVLPDNLFLNFFSIIFFRCHHFLEGFQS